MKKINEYRYLNKDIAKTRELVLQNFFNNGDLNNCSFVGLDMYNKTNNFNQRIRSIIFHSIIDESIILTNEQIEILTLMSDNNIFLSAPTSFGKTFIVLEFIKRNLSKLNNIIFIVPTLALMNELLKKIYNLFGDSYNICINQEEELSDRNFFIFVPERSDLNFLKKISNLKIDLLVFDEIYKLQLSNKREISSDDRLMLMNKVYLNLIKKCKKVFLLGPFIKNVSFDQTSLNIVKYYTNFLPVFNKVEFKCNEDWVNNIDYNNELIYFSTPKSIYRSIDKICKCIPENPCYIQKFNKEIEYLEKEIGGSWYIIDLLKRGIGIHHGKTPMFLRKFYETAFNNNELKILLCTNTLMEGINTPTQRLVIVDNPGDSFKLNNLIGRVGRLNTNNPKIGNIIITNEDVKKLYTDIDNWADLVIMAEDTNVNSLDEVIHLNKKPKTEQQKAEFHKKIDFLKTNFKIDETKIKNSNTKLNTVYKFAVNDYIEKFNKCTSVKEVLYLSIDIVEKIGYIFDKKDFENMGAGYLPYKLYVLDILNGNNVKNMLRYFNINLNKNNNKVNMNLFVDKIYELRTWIRFKLVKIINYFELFNISDKNLHVKKFIGMLTSYCDKEIMYKVFSDLGIEERDFENIKNIITTKKISTSNIIKDIRNNKSNLNIKNISPFTIRNINNI